MKEVLTPTPTDALTPTPANLAEATQALQSAHAAVLAALNAEAGARLSLDTARAEALLAGVDGKNEAARSAALDQRLSAERTELHGAERLTREARTALAIAEARLTCLRYQVRLLEAAQ